MRVREFHTWSEGERCRSEVAEAVAGDEAVEGGDEEEEEEGFNIRIMVLPNTSLVNHKPCVRCTLYLFVTLFSEVGSFVHPCEEDLVCKGSIEKVPYFNAPIYLENKSQIGKVDEIFGPMHSYVKTLCFECVCCSVSCFSTVLLCETAS